MTRIAIVGGARFGTTDPYAGGLEAHTADLAAGLRSRGHDVIVFSGRSACGSDAALWEDAPTTVQSRNDISITSEDTLAEAMAYQRTMVRIARMATRDQIDHIHLNCCHHLPFAMTPVFDVPVTATLHSPPSDLLLLAYRYAALDGHAPATAAVSRDLARSYASHGEFAPRVIHNGVDLDAWAPGTGDGGYAVWSGRLVPEKAPHLAIDAAKLAGIPLRIAGPAHDSAYFEAEIAPRLSHSVTWEGHLDRSSLARLLGGAQVCLVTPVWAEPFGLVAVEAMACGTPVAAFAKGALRELLTPETGVVTDPTVEALAARIATASRLDRGAVRRRAESVYSRARMLDDYEFFFAAAASARALTIESAA